MSTALGTAEILHHGYTKELVRDRNKVERNLKLLRAALAENPADANLLMNLGLELVRSDDLRGGIEKYREAFARMAAQATEIVPELREALLTQFTSQLYKVRGHEEVVRVLNSPLAKNHGGLNASLHLALGLSLFELKKFSEAAPQMRECIAKRLLPALTPINVDIHTAAPWHCLALCQLRTGDTTGAEKSFAEAVAANGRANEARVDFAKFLAEQNRAVDALKELHAAITADETFALAWRLGGQLALAQPELLDFALDWTGEALRNLPEDLLLQSNRAEALLLTGKISEAATFWTGVWKKDHLPRSLAALSVCRLALGENLSAPGSPAEEEQCSRAFIGWYQRLLGAQASETIHHLNENLFTLATALPTAEKILRAAFVAAGHEVKISADA
jgi:tetratricopeptide (TPR) repeat protein